MHVAATNQELEETNTIQGPSAKPDLQTWIDLRGKLDDLKSKEASSIHESQTVIDGLNRHIAAGDQHHETLRKEIEALKESLQVEQEHTATTRKQYIEVSIETQRLKRQVTTLEQERKELIEALFQITNDHTNKHSNAFKRGTIQDVLAFYGVQMNDFEDPVTLTSSLEARAETSSSNGNEPGFTSAIYSKPLPSTPASLGTTTTTLQNQHQQSQHTLAPVPTIISAANPPATPDKKLHGILKNSQGGNAYSNHKTMQPPSTPNVDPPTPATIINSSSGPQVIAPKPSPKIPPPSVPDAMMQVGPGSDAWNALLNLLDQTEKSQSQIAHIRRSSDASDHSMYDVYNIKPRSSSLVDAKSQSSTSFGLKLKLPFRKDNNKKWSGDGGKGSQNLATDRKNSIKEEDEDEWASAIAPIPKGRRPSSAASVEHDEIDIEEEFFGKKVTFA